MKCIRNIESYNGYVSIIGNILTSKRYTIKLEIDLDYYF